MAAVQVARGVGRDPLDKDAFAACPSDSIDYAVMEKTDAAMVLPVDIGWNDVGSWSALWDVSEQDADGNAHHGDVIAIDSRNSYAYAQRLVALVGVDDLVVVETDDAVLVAQAWPNGSARVLVDPNALTGTPAITDFWPSPAPP